MTPEAARSMGFELTKSAIVEWLSRDGSLAGFLSEIESNVSGDTEAGPLPAPLVPHALRGAAAFFSEVSREIEAVAVVREAAR